MRRYVIVALLAVSLAAQQPSPDLGKAFSILQSDPAGAVKILDDLTAREPNNVRAWRLLGTALLRTKSPHRAIEALNKSLQLEPDSAPALYNLGVAYAMKGDKDAAFSWLAKAKATKQLDISQIAVDDDLKSLIADP